MPESTCARTTDLRSSTAFSWRRLLKPAVFVACLMPMALLLWATVNGQLSANPLEDIRDTTGIWTLRFLLLTLCITPLRRITRWHSLMRFRRMLGLFTFFHGVLHFVTYVWLDQFFAFDEMIKDLARRRFIMAGYVSFALLIPLAMTSTKKWIGRLGGKHWQLLHRLIYISAAAGVVHYFWRVKLDIQRPVIYGAVLSLLLAFRFVRTVRQQKVGPSAPPHSLRDR
jgi:sulfoxide reductase heme-binding subunit YedZ